MHNSIQRIFSHYLLSACIRIICDHTMLIFYYLLLLHFSMLLSGVALYLIYKIKIKKSKNLCFINISTSSISAAEIRFQSIINYNPWQIWNKSGFWTNASLSAYWYQFYYFFEQVILLGRFHIQILNDCVRWRQSKK